MFATYTAKYAKITTGYMGQLVEWPEIVTEGRDIEDCRDMLRDALNEMILAYQHQGKEIPVGSSLIVQASSTAAKILIRSTAATEAGHYAPDV